MNNFLLRRSLCYIYYATNTFKCVCVEIYENTRALVKKIKKKKYWKNTKKTWQQQKQVIKNGNFTLKSRLKNCQSWIMIGCATSSWPFRTTFTSANTRTCVYVAMWNQKKKHKICFRVTNFGAHMSNITLVVSMLQKEKK